MCAASRARRRHSQSSAPVGALAGWACRARTRRARAPDQRRRLARAWSRGAADLASAGRRPGERRQPIDRCTRHCDDLCWGSRACARRPCVQYISFVAGAAGPRRHTTCVDSPPIVRRWSVALLCCFARCNCRAELPASLRPVLNPNRWGAASARDTPALYRHFAGHASCFGRAHYQRGASAAQETSVMSAAFSLGLPTPAPSTEIQAKPQDPTATDISFELPPAAIASDSSDANDLNFRAPLSPVVSSRSAGKQAVPKRKASTAVAKASLAQEYVLPPPPTRSRKIIQMKPRTASTDNTAESSSAASSRKSQALLAPAPSSKSAMAAAPVQAPTAAASASTGAKRKQHAPAASTAAGRKMARKTAHSLIERRRRSKMNEEFGVLKDMIPECKDQEMHKLAILQVCGFSSDLSLLTVHRRVFAICDGSRRICRSSMPFTPRADTLCLQVQSPIKVTSVPTQAVPCPAQTTRKCETCLLFAKLSLPTHRHNQAVSNPRRGCSHFINFHQCPRQEYTLNRHLPVSLPSTVPWLTRIIFHLLFLLQCFQVRQFRRFISTGVV
jgi:Helix-loop-helix DNA-binding domain